MRAWAGVPVESVRVACWLKAGRDRAGKEQGVWSVRDRGGGTSSPSPSAPPPVAISPRSSARGNPGEELDTAAPLIYARALPTHPIGAGEERRRRGWGGGAGRERTGIPAEMPAGRIGEMCRVRERERQGRGNEFPRPAGRHPQWRYPHGPQHGEILEKSRIRLPTRYRHARTPPPRRGRGRSAEGAGGVGAAGRERMGIPCESTG